MTMDIYEFLITPAEATRLHGPHDRIVMSSRVRLARNLKNAAYPGWAKKPERIKVLETIRPAVESLPEMKDAFSEAMDNLGALDKQILVERHLISREHAAKSSGSGLVLNREETFCVMINEEDHLRMQALRPGLQLRQAWSAIDQFDSQLEKKLDYAFSNELGYLTACPTNLGTGIRVSAMLHLPGLVLAEQINPIIQSVNKLGLAVRGLYGEGTEALGNLFQVSNQMTLLARARRTPSWSGWTRSCCRSSSTRKTRGRRCWRKRPRRSSITSGAPTEFWRTRTAFRRRKR